MADVTSEPADYPTRPDAEAELAFAAARAKRVTVVRDTPNGGAKWLSTTCGTGSSTPPRS